MKFVSNINTTVNKIVLLFFILTSSAYATVDTFQEGVSSYAGTTDTSISQDNPTTNYATASTNSIENWFSSHKNRSLIKFDISSISSSATVSSATLTLWYTGSCNDNINVRAHRVYKPWTESGATWNTWDGSNAWTTAGADNADDSGSDNSGNGTGADRRTSDDGYLLFNECIGGFTSHDITITTMVQNWVNGTWNNNGMWIAADTGNPSAGSFASSENSTSSIRPLLTVTYTVGGGSSGSSSTVRKRLRMIQ